ncbi:MAG: hypothetical protein H0W81_06530 [Chloroflexi bacterium]|nr:hypothetical protein [Chloroflexota bacterium]
MKVDVLQLLRLHRSPIELLERLLVNVETSAQENRADIDAAEQAHAAPLVVACLILTEELRVQPHHLPARSITGLVRRRQVTERRAFKVLLLTLLLPL